MIENGVDTAFYSDLGVSDQSGARRIVFVGSMDYHANIDGVVGGATVHIERLVGDKQLRVRLGLAARRDAMAHYTWSAVARPVREAYERLAEASA